MDCKAKIMLLPSQCTNCRGCKDIHKDWGALGKEKKEEDALKMSKERAEQNFNIEKPEVEVD